MKKLFTLLVSVLLAGSAFGQKTWTNVVTNSDMQGEVPDYAAVDQNQAGAWNSFWVHEWRGDQTERYDGTTEIAGDPADPTNLVAKIVIRSRAEGEAAGNLTPDYTGNPGTYGSWDCQFFIYATAPIPEGKEIRLSMKIKGDRAGTLETQAHSLPGTYIDANMFGNISYGTEWSDYKSDVVTVTSTMAGTDTTGPFQSIAFNLCTDEDANVLYFDDIKLQIRDPKEETGEASWINFMRKGIDSNDPISQVNYGNGTDSLMVDVSNFMIQIRDNELNTNILVPAPIVELEDGKRAVKVPTLDHYTAEVPVYEEDGVTQKLDDDGNPMTETHYFWSDGTDIGTSAPARYSSQFFVSTLHKMKSGERYKFVFWVKADKPAALGTQAHTLPTRYQAYDTFGGTSAFPVSTEWTKYELGEAQNQKIPSGANGCQTVAFDCYDLQEENNYYFIFEEFSFSEENVLISDRTLGTPQDLQLPINEGEEEEATTIDATPMLAAFEVDDFSFLNNGKDGIKLFMLQEPDDPEDDPIETFSGILNWTDGGFVNADGNYIDDDQGVQMFFDDSSIDGKNIDIKVWNNPDAGIPFAEGKTVQTKLAVSQSGWYYIYNVTLGTKETLAGIQTVKTEKSGNGLIYNLSGQRVDGSYKGLVIKNGQKFVQK